MSENLSTNSRELANKVCLLSGDEIDRLIGWIAATLRSHPDEQIRTTIADFLAITPDATGRPL